MRVRSALRARALQVDFFHMNQFEARSEPGFKNGRVDDERQLTPVTIFFVCLGSHHAQHSGEYPFSLALCRDPATTSHMGGKHDTLWGVGVGKLAMSQMPLTTDNFVYTLPCLQYYKAFR